MKPKITCTQCGTALSLNVQQCPSCGALIEWSGTQAPAAERPAVKERAEKNKGSKSRQVAWGPIIIAVGAVVVFLVVILTDQRPASGGASQGANMPTQQMPPQGGMQQGANMQMLEQIDALEAQVKANPDDLNAQLRFANTLHDARFYERAVATYKEYLTKRSKDVNARVDMAICMHEMGNSAAAIDEMKKALKDDPKHLQAHFNLGIITLASGDVKASNEWFKKTVALDPNSEIGKRAQQLLSQHNPQQLQ